MLMELLYAPSDDGAAVRARCWSCSGAPYRSCSPRSMLMELLSTLNADKWTDHPSDRPGNWPGIQGKLPVKHRQMVQQVFFPSLLFLWWMHSFSYVRGFPMRVFTRL